MRVRSLIPFLIAIILTLCLLASETIPLGIPGEWTWQRIPFNGPALLFGVIISLILFIVYLFITLWGLSRIRDCSRGELAVWLTTLAICSFLWSFYLQDAPPAEYSLSKAPFVLYYKGSSGYFTEANTGIENVSDYLAQYETKMEAGDVLHEGTHPPGLPLFYRALIRLCETSPGLQSFLIESQPASFQFASEIIAETTAMTPHPLTQQDRAVLWCATLITLIASALTVIPLFLLAREFSSRHVSWQVAAFWPLVPAALIFQPKSDALYSVLALLFLYSWVLAWRRHSALCFVLAGLLIWSGLFLTLAFLPVALCAVLYSFFCAWQQRTATPQSKFPWKRLLSAAGWSLCGFGVPLVLLGLLFHLNLPRVWLLNLQNHAGFYAEYPRTYWKWLLLNPLEISLALGLPLTWLVVKSLCRRHFQASTAGATSPTGLSSLLFSTVIVLGLLWLSGKNMGEAARLWLIFLPWLLLWTIPFWQNREQLREQSQQPVESFFKQQSIWIYALLAQAVVCVATVYRVTGFHFPPG
ncbi:hypothetical protein [Gimesia panareensis]|uniref:Uncharacterized protein n=1 Tax=Gimesia panareensis TaxID=2527978 RepID=A0A517Q2P6_9PLAN|nr:hypothetical protein [Gimesia panareensis]QDT25890.1 hypothetical protein Enr10x_11880 [Gimesia panareensis]QDU48827.1 hypothetical protein Pan110_11430 [Gimesia panareensis]